jgi:hypothetical protein
MLDSGGLLVTEYSSPWVLSHIQLTFWHGLNHTLKDKRAVESRSEWLQIRFSLCASSLECIGQTLSVPQQS